MQVEILYFSNDNVVFTHNDIKLLVQECLIAEMDIEEFDWCVNMCENGLGDELGYKLIINV